MLHGDAAGMKQDESNEQQLDAETTARSIEAAYRMLPMIVAMTAIVPVPLSLLSWHSAPAWMVVLWVVTHWVVSGARYLTYRRYCASPDRRLHQHRWIRALNIGYAASGLAWSALGTVLYPAADNWAQGVLTFVVTGLATIGVLSTGSMRTAFRCYILSFLLPITVYKLWLGGAQETSLALMSLLFAIVLITISSRAANDALGMIRVRAESERLALRLADAIAQSQAKNDALQREMADRARAEKQKLSADARLHLALESAGMHSWEYDLAQREVTVTGVAPKDTTEVNASGERFVRYSEHAHPDDREALLAAVAKARAVGDIFRAEFRIKPAGTWRWMSARGRVVAADDGTLRMIGVSQDITRRREAQEELLKAKENAEAASRAKSQFLANMSHEIRTPLNGVVGMLELLAGSSLTAQQAQMAQSASRSSEALLAVINDILDISKIEANRLEIEAVVFDASQLVEDVTSLLADTATRKGVVLACRIDPSIPREIVGDPHRLRQVMINLVANAVKFTERGQVDVELVLLPAEDTAHARFEFTVRDTGIGLTADEVSRLFQPFSQADMSTSRRFGGTGLGLAISRQLVELMGGSVTVSSTPGAGSTFAFGLTLPIGAPALVTAVTRAAVVPTEPVRGIDMLVPTDKSVVTDVPTSRSRARVLVVEDHEINRLVAREMLIRLDCDVVLAEGGEDGVAAAAAESFDLILMDCQMPVVDGFEATRRIRAAERDSARNTIVALTANALQGDRDRCLAAGMDDYLTKPFSRASLAALLDQWLSSRAAPTASPDQIRKVDPERATLDVQALSDVRSMDDDGSLLQGIITMFLHDGAGLTAAIREAQGEGDTAGIAFAAHKLKSSSGCVGAREVAAICAQIEASARIDRSVCSDTELDVLDAAFAATCGALTAYLDGARLNRAGIAA